MDEGGALGRLHQVEEALALGGKALRPVHAGGIFHRVDGGQMRDLAAVAGTHLLAGSLEDGSFCNRAGAQAGGHGAAGRAFCHGADLVLCR